MSSSTAGSTGQKILDGILRGEVPRQVRLFAAQGLLPVSRDDLLRMQVLLSADPDDELAKLAQGSIQEMDDETVVTWIRSCELKPIELDLLSRIRTEEPVWAAIAVHPQVSDETLRVLAKNATPLLQDIIITNQVRLLQCLEILDSLRSNPQATQVVLRRVREFEEEFIEKMAAQAEQELLAEEQDPRRGPSIDEALTALRDIGAHIPGEREMPYVRSDDPGVAAEVEKFGVGAFGRLLRMGVKEKIICAMKGNREERAILINSRNRLVVRAVLASPKLTDLEIERYATSRSVSDDVIRIIAANPRWVRRYGVALALTQNPKTPVQASLRMMTSLSNRDLVRLSRDRNINPIVRRKAIEQCSLRRR